MEILVGKKFIDLFKNRIVKIITIFILILIVFIIFWINLVASPRRDNPVLIHISKGDSLFVISKMLKEKNIVKSESFLRSVIASLDRDKNIEIGDYYFNKPLNIYQVAFMFARGDHNIEPVKITFPEGLTNNQMTDILIKKIPDFNKTEFIIKTKDKQGYLFPDTYFFFPLTGIDEIIFEIDKNFKARTEDLFKDKNNIDEIITMASIVELEAKDENDAPVIAGILWKRLILGMPLQVDAYPETYKKKGLPENPIANPGLRAINATVNKKETPYLYYLHAKDGKIYLAKTYIEHRKNIAKYLK